MIIRENINTPSLYQGINVIHSRDMLTKMSRMQSVDVVS